MTTRKLGSDGLGEKTVLGLENKRLLALGLPMMDELKGNIKVRWEERQKQYRARYGVGNGVGVGGCGTRGTGVSRSSCAQ